jgi:hypothetical protein
VRDDKYEVTGGLLRKMAEIHPKISEELQKHFPLAFMDEERWVRFRPQAEVLAFWGSIRIMDDDRAFGIIRDGKLSIRSECRKDYRVTLTKKYDNEASDDYLWEKRGD